MTRSNGKAGETLAQYLFNTLGWRMDRSQPPFTITKVHADGKVTGYFSKGGIADFVGEDKDSKYIACEVKEASGNTCPCSRLSPSQRDWMNTVRGQRYVAVYWLDHGLIERFEYKEKGSYKFGGGAK